MIDLKLDKATNDLVLSGDGDLTLVSGNDDLAQRIAVMLRAWRGEWFTDATFGMPWLDVLQRKPEATEIAVAEIVAAVSALPEVEDVRELTTDFNGASRTFRVDIAIRTVTGETVTVGV